MYFRKLELLGFKSFPERKEFIFEPGITAIVGPNGCGKTNIADGIRWVLGEQSAHTLRGSRMEDVIFNGSKVRKPLEMAEVSLTLLNPEKILPIEYSELTITRRLFRSGESEFYINKVPCRLKDISELIMDTGIGTEAYSVIEQGKVDLILSSRPEDRRSIFEEAAGIMRYKTRKKEALRKLESTEQNLLRVSDIIHEVEHQMNSLKRQVSKARRYQKRREELKELEIKLASSQFHSLRKNLELSAKGTKEFEEGVAKVKSKVEQGERRIEHLRAELLNMEGEAAEAQSKILDLTSSTHRTENKVALFQERLTELSRGRKRDEEELEKLAIRESKIDKDIKTIGERIEELAKGREDKEEKTKQNEQLLEEISQALKQRRRNIERDKEKAFDLLSEETKLKNGIGSLKAEKEALLARRRRLEVELSKTKGEREELKSKLHQSLAHLEEMRESILGLKKEQKNIESKTALLGSELSELKNCMTSKREDLSSKGASLKVLKEMKESYEGYQEGVRAVMHGGLSGICGVVADLIELPTELERAIEVALGERAQDVIVETFEQAKGALDYLKSKGKGRATFLPLDTIKSEKGADKEGLKEAIGIASKMVNFDPKYQKAFSYLLGRTVVTRDLDSAIRIVRHRSTRVVTLDGELIEPEGPIRGGRLSSERRHGLLRREAKLKELKEEICNIEAKLSKMDSHKEEIGDELSLSNNELGKIRENLKRQEISLSGEESKCGHLKEEDGRLEDEASLLTKETEGVDEEREGIESEMEELCEKLAKLEERKGRLQDGISSSQHFIETEGKRRERLLHELTDLRVDFTSLLEKERGIKEKLSILKGSKLEYAKTRSERIAQIKEGEERKGQFESTIKETRLELEELLKEKSTFQGKAEELERNKEELRKKIEEVERKVEKGREGLDEEQKSLGKLQLSNAQLEMEITTIKDRVSTNYQVSLSDLPMEEVDQELISQEVAKLRAKLDSIGSVNLAALEQYEELEERHTFLSQQRDDLLKAKESLQQVIGKINLTTRSLFMKTLMKVRENFDEIFKFLFGGGKADLVLVDESDVLESGIDIVVSPPGKRLQTISLLSGGERALTAIALLFAILKVKPSPFCILDEIDAPLDDSNIDRFIKLLKKFVKQSQFIIITHNKNTISIADAMYGVTMEESGVSKLVSVRFAESKEPTTSPAS